MDRLDRYTVLALAVLLACAALIGARFQEELLRKTFAQSGRSKAAAPATDSDLRLKSARELMLSGNVSRAEPLLMELLKSRTYDAEIFMLLGDVEMKKLDATAALPYYQEAVDLNPDLLDKKTPSFQGKKIKVAVEEARVELEKKLRDAPGDEYLGKARRTMYYLLRRIAGSCG